MSEQEPNWFKRHKILTVILVLVVIGVIGGAAGGSSNTSTKQEASTATPEQAKPAEPTAEKWDVDANYAKINNGMTKAESEAALGKSGNCSESNIEYIGKTETCSYGSFTDKGMITITYSSDKVSSKAKNNF